MSLRLQADGLRRVQDPCRSLIRRRDAPLEFEYLYAPPFEIWFGGVMFYSLAFPR